MTTTAAHRVKNYLDWIGKQKQPISHDHIVEAGATSNLLPRDATSRIVTLLLTHDYLHMGEDLEHMPRYSLDRPRLANMAQATLEELIRICSNETTQGKSTVDTATGEIIQEPHPSPGPGAPAGNTNALKHGRYSLRFNPLEGRPATGYTIDGEIALVTSILETLTADHGGDLNLVLKAITTLARLKVAATALASRNPPEPPRPLPLPGESNGA